MVIGTIAGHLEHYVRSGVIRINDLVPQEKVDKITQYLQQHADAPSITLIKAGLGDDVSYADIRVGDGLVALRSFTFCTKHGSRSISRLSCFLFG